MRFSQARSKNRSQKVRQGTSVVVVLLVALASSSCVDAQTSDADEDSSAAGGSGPSSGGAQAGGGKAGGSGGQSGGAPGTGGAVPAGGNVASGGGDGGAMTGGEAGQSGTGGLGGQSGTCELPFDSGVCDAAFPVYFHNSQTGRCEPAIYGGCGGNENRFETITECEQACGVIRQGRACAVNGVVYPHGWGTVPDPASCNTCSCDDGELTACTERDCPHLCPEGSSYGTDCAECGPTDDCLTVRHACLPTCNPELECSEGFCSGSGVCVTGFCG